VTNGVTDTKVKKVSYKFDIVFLLVFLAISIICQLHLHYLQYKGGLVNQFWLLGFGPVIYYLMAEILLLLFCAIRFFKRIFLYPRTKKQILIKLFFAGIPIIIFFDSWMLSGSLVLSFLKGFEKWVQKEVDVKSIQQCLATEGSQYQGEHYIDGDFPKDFPACLTKTKPIIISFKNSEIDGSLYIELTYGGGMEMWGVRIGPPSMKMPKEGMIKIRESYYEYRRPIAPGVYIFDGG
jgi:hypothetical protein